MNLLRAEWTKIRSVRSTWIAAVSIVLSGAVLSVLAASDLLGKSPSELPEPWDPTAVSLKGMLFARLVIGMLGALSVTSEYATGMISTSLATVPARSRLLAAKTIVVAAIAFGTAVTTVLVSFATGQLMFSSAGLPIASIGDPRVAGALVGAVLYMTLVALIGVAVGVLMRSTTSSLVIFVGAMLLVPALAPGLPGALGEWFARYWPITAGQAVYTVMPADGTVAPWLGLGILAAATVGVGVAGLVAFRARDV